MKRLSPKTRNCETAKTRENSRGNLVAARVDWIVRHRSSSSTHHHQPRNPHGQYRRGDDGEMEVVSLGHQRDSNLRRGATIEGASSDSASMKATMATRLASLIHVRCRFCSRASMRAASCRLISSMPSIECADDDDGDVVWVDVVEEDDRGTSGIDGAMRGRARRCVNGASRRRSWFVACARA